MQRPTIHERQATQLSEQLPVEPGNVSRLRAIVLANESRTRQTLGFPSLSLAKPKRVAFSTPLYARCTSVDGLWATNCRVLSVWDLGAQIEAILPGDLTQFHLLFTPPPRLVSKQCRRVSTRGNLIEVLYLRRQPTFLLNASLDL